MGNLTHVTDINFDIMKKSLEDSYLSILNDYHKYDDSKMLVKYEDIINEESLLIVIKIKL